MNQQERDNLKAAFQEMSLELQDIRKRLDTIERNYPGFLRDQLYVSLATDVLASEGNASALADYIDVGSDEQWDVK